MNPVWNYTFIYDDVTLQELAERCLELTVWDHDRLASNEFLGGVRFSLGTGKLTFSVASKYQNFLCLILVILFRFFINFLTPLLKIQNVMSFISLLHY